MRERWGCMCPTAKSARAAALCQVHRAHRQHWSGAAGPAALFSVSGGFLDLYFHLPDRQGPIRVTVLDMRASRYSIQ